jgi:hypothetical protein
MQLMQDSIDDFPLYLDEIDMTNFGRVRGMKDVFSQKQSQSDSNNWHWRWHYRALTVQNKYADLVRCFLGKNGYNSDEALLNDGMAQAYWSEMQAKLPALRRTLARPNTWARADKKLDRQTLINFVSTMAVWVSWIHEDVGHAAAAYVYNPVHTPMLVPEDGNGIVLETLLFNHIAYRGFVFLNRAKLLDEAPDYWFKNECTTTCLRTEHRRWWQFWKPRSWCAQESTRCVSDKECFTGFQNELRNLGNDDTSFSECDKTGFYSCVERVETAVSS